MGFVRYSVSFAVGATGLCTGLFHHNLSYNRHFLIYAAKPVKLEIDAVVSKDIEEYVAQFTPMMKYGFPSFDTLLIKGNFVISYDRRHRLPNWVMEHLTSDMLEDRSSGSRYRSKYFEDSAIHNYFRATLNDYRDSGYDRGHLAAAANYKFCQRSLDDTFILSNITPQNEYFNQVTWRALEKRVRDLAMKYGSVYICSGPLYLPREIHADEDQLYQILQGQSNKRKRKRNEIQSTQQKTKKYVIYEVIGENNVAVPTHFFKIIVCETDDYTYDMEAYIVPNQKLDPQQPLSNYMVPRDTIERAAGFLLFHQLPSRMFRYINGEECAIDL